MLPAAVLFLCAGPVPHPAPLTPADLAGRWEYRYAGETGWIEFDPSGFYRSRFDRTETNAGGSWQVTDRGEVRLSEWTWWIDIEDGHMRGPQGPTAWVMEPARSRDRFRLEFRLWWGEGAGWGHPTPVTLIRRP